MQRTKNRTIASNSSKRELIYEVYGDEPYAYYPLGRHIVVAPGVCGGRPTFKYTRLEVSMILASIAAGQSVQEIVRAYALSQLTPEAVTEAIHLADTALSEAAQGLQLAA